MIIQKTDIPALLDTLSAQSTVYVPGIDNNVSRFVVYGPNVEPRFDLQNTKMPPKDMLFPMTEKMYRWAKSDDGLKIESELDIAEPFVLFGVRPCDVAAIERLDQVFLTKGYVDEFYETKRNAATIVAIACAHTDETCFCDSMGGSPHEAPAADIVLKEGENAYEVIAQTEKGTAALEVWKPHMTEGEVQAPTASCTLSVNMDGVPEKLHDMFEDAIWQDVANTCLTCGTCTFVCPTCYCFDISQDVRADEGNRFRCWDSCMFTDYTQMAGGHNPRAQKSARVRQRFMHKLSYFYDRYGTGLCIGCGRCIKDCPVAVDISLIIDRIAAASPDPEAQSKAASAEAEEGCSCLK